MDAQNVHIGERIKDARKKANLTQQQMADRLRVTLRGYQKWESGERRCSLDLLRTIAEELQLTMSDLIGDRGATRADLDDAVETATGLTNEYLKDVMHMLQRLATSLGVKPEWLLGQEVSGTSERLDRLEAKLDELLKRLPPT